jgi:hypothetical protein
MMPDSARRLRFSVPSFAGRASPMTERWQQPERRTRVEARARFEEIRAEIGSRLQKVCASMAPADFESLVYRMTRLRLKYQAESATCSS